MSAPRPDPLGEYLTRLRDALPPAKAADVADEVSALVADRVEIEGGSVDDPAAVERALSALGKPESLAAALGGDSVTIDAATRRAFVRWLAVLFAGHLVLSIVLAVMGTVEALLPGLVEPLPRENLFASACGVLSILFLDVGLLTVFFALVGRDRVPKVLPRLRLSMPGTRRDAVLSLLLLGLVAVILNSPSLRDSLISVGPGHQRAPVLAPDAIGLLPLADAVLLLFGLRHVVLLVSGGERVQGLVLDALASLAAVALAIAVMTRPELVRIPPTASLSAEQAKVFQDLLVRVCLVVAFVASLLLATRFVRRCLRLKDLLSVPV
jgi:hypothetical protein